MSSRYDLMKYVRCGNSGLKLPLVSFGGWHNFQDFDSARRLALKAWELGITHFDLANNYGPPPGSAEENFGRLLRGDLAAHRDELVISTKAGYHMWAGPYGEWGSKKYLTASLHQSLRRLGLEYVDIFYSHRFDPETPLEETMGALSLAVQQGKALYAGISNYPAKAVKKAAKIMKKLGTPLLIHQCSYHMLNRSIEGKVLEETEQGGMGMIVFSPLAQGMLTNRYLAGIPADSRAASASGFLKREQIKPELVDKLRKLEAMAQKRGQSLARMALDWILRDTRITSVLIGASKPEQIAECCGVVGDELFTAEELRQIEQILNPAPPTPAAKAPAPRRSAAKAAS
jgi:L-glyceraldehyde 3-phosphate reductase